MAPHDALNRLAQEAFCAGRADVAGELLRQVARGAADAGQLYADAIRHLYADGPRNRCFGRHFNKSRTNPRGTRRSA